MEEIKGNVQRVVKRRKDSGFTLIELMIVIAVIGILAVVLVPKVGNVKTQAKSAGIDTNVRMVQAYAESQINNWSDSTSDTSDVVADIESDLSDMKNPFGNDTDAIIAGSAPTLSGVGGAIYVSASGSGSSYTVKITWTDSKGNSDANKKIEVKR